MMKFDPERSFIVWQLKINYDNTGYNGSAPFDQCNIHKDKYGFFFALFSVIAIRLYVQYIDILHNNFFFRICIIRKFKFNWRALLRTKAGFVLATIYFPCTVILQIFVPFTFIMSRSIAEDWSIQVSYLKLVTSRLGTQWFYQIP